MKTPALVWCARVIALSPLVVVVGALALKAPLVLASFVGVVLWVAAVTVAVPDGDDGGW